MRLAMLTESGIQEFRVLLAEERATGGGVSTELQERYVALCGSDSVTRTVRSVDGSEIPVQETLPHTRRRELGSYLVGLLSEVPGVTENDGIWAWLSLLWLDQLRPTRGTGPGQDYRYIPSHDYKNYYRHLLQTPYRVCEQLGDGAGDGLDDAMVLLANEVRSPGDMNEQLASRQELWSNREILAAATTLYFDTRTGRIKSGAGSTKKGDPGTMRRFVGGFVDQFSVTWDLPSMDRNQILEFLPEEFDRFR